MASEFNNYCHYINVLKYQSRVQWIQIHVCLTVLQHAPVWTVKLGQ